MIDQLNKDTSKRVKEWAISIGFKPSNISVRAGSGKAGYIQLYIRPIKNPNFLAPQTYEKTLPPDVCRRMLEVIYPDAKWLKENPNQYSAGNVHTHMASMVTSEWIKFLENEIALAGSKP